MNKTLVINIPHSSTTIPDTDGFMGDLYLDEINLLTDHATDKIFNIQDVDKVICDFSRVYCDVERFVDDDKEIMSQQGMGFIYTHTDDGKLMRNVDNNLKSKIFNNYYQPYQKKLEEVIQTKLNTNYGSITIIDAHSFSDEPFKRDLDKKYDRPDFCLGVDEFHTSQELIDFFQKSFEKEGYSIKINSPYSGTIVPEKFYKKDKRVESIMIEINRKLYMDKFGVINERVNFFNELLTKIIISLKL